MMDHRYPTPPSAPGQAAPVVYTVFVIFAFFTRHFVEMSIFYILVV